jgi:formate-dependent nitrite reductase membrane component NrfD
MLELAVKGNKWYWGWLVVLLGVIGAGFGLYLMQLKFGLGITGMSRDVSWGFYIANFTYLVGVAAGGVMVVLPYYLHDYKAYGKITILGEFLAIAAIVMCLLFILVDLGQPMRALNVLLYPTPNSVLFYDAIVLNGYLFLNLVIGWNVLEAERNGVHYQSWLKPLIYISIPWAVSIHTVTAYLYCGLPGRHFWLTAVLAPRFLASAFAAGPALLILLCLFIRRFTNFDPGRQQIQALAKTVAYAICINVFFFLCEVFVAFYSQIPGHMDPPQVPVRGPARPRRPGTLDVGLHDPHGHRHRADRHPGDAQERDLPGHRLRRDHHGHLDRQGPGHDLGRVRTQPDARGQRIRAHHAGNRHYPGRLCHGCPGPDGSLQNGRGCQGRGARLIAAPAT